MTPLTQESPEIMTAPAEELAVSWSEYPPLPGGLGFAGAFAGSHNGALIVVGGANFPEKPPWEGGPKVYYDTFYVLEAGADPEWIEAGKLPAPMGYGMSISTPEGLVCAGGSNGKDVLNTCFLLTWDAAAGKVLSEPLPDLPLPLKTGGGVLYQDAIYLAGGTCPEGAANCLFKLDWKARKTWERLPDFPGAPRNAAALSAALGPGGGEFLFLFGGTSFPDSEPVPFVGRDVLGYNLAAGKWKPLGAIQPPGWKPMAFCSAQVMALDEETILLTGGRGNQNLAEILLVLRQRKEAEDASDTERHAGLQKQVDDYFMRTEFKFNRELLVYHGLTGKWQHVGFLPGKARTGSNLLPWTNGFVIPSGEIRPGVRTPTVMRAQWRVK